MSVVFDSVRPHRQQPTRLPHPWDSLGKNTGVGYHFLLQCMKVKSQSESLSCVRLLATPWTAAHQAPASMGFSRQEYWSGVPSPSPCRVAGGYFYVCEPRAFLPPCLLPGAWAVPRSLVSLATSRHSQLLQDCQDCWSGLPNLSGLSCAQPHRSWLPFNSITATLLCSLSRWLSGKESVCNSGDAGNTGLIPEVR